MRRLFLLFFFVVYSALHAADVVSQYNSAVELAKTGKEAVEKLKHLAAVPEKDIAARSLALLGQLTVKQDLAQAEQYFIDSLALQDSEKVRRDLENLRAWRFQESEQETEKQRAEQRQKSFQERVKQLADWQSKLADTVGGEILPDATAADRNIAPKQAQIFYETAREQKNLTDELPDLLSKADEDAQKKVQEQGQNILKKSAEAVQLLSDNKAKETLPLQKEVRDFLHSLLKQDKNGQHDSDRQEQENHEQEKPSDSADSRNTSPDADKNPKSGSEEKDELKAEQMLLQVRRKEQEADKRREQLKVQQQQAQPVDKDW